LKKDGGDGIFMGVERECFKHEEGKTELFRGPQRRGKKSHEGYKKNFGKRRAAPP